MNRLFSFEKLPFANFDSEVSTSDKIFVSICVGCYWAACISIIFKKRSLSAN